MPAERKLRSVLRFLLRLLPVLILAAGVTFFHWRGLQPGYTFLPVDLAKTILPWGDGAPRVLQNWLISDPLYQFYPFLIQAVDSVRQGQWLLWDPGIMLGHPAAADPLFQTFYPGVLPFGLLFGAGRGYGIALYVHALLAALLMYGFLRALRISAAAAVAGAFTYALSGYLVTWFEFSFWLTHAGVAARCAVGVRAGRAHGQLAVRGAGRDCAWGWRCWQGSCSLSSFLSVFSWRGRWRIRWWGAARADTGTRACPEPARGRAGYAGAADSSGHNANIARGRWWPLVAAVAVAVGLGGLIGAVQVVMTADFLPLTHAHGGVWRQAGCRSRSSRRCCCPTSLATRAAATTGAPATSTRRTIYVGIVALFLAAAGACPVPAAAALCSLSPVSAALVLLYLMIGGPGTGLLQVLPGDQPGSPVALCLFAAAAGRLAGGGDGRRRRPLDAPGFGDGAGVGRRGRRDGSDLLESRHCRQPAPAAARMSWWRCCWSAAAVAALVVRIRAPRYHTAANWTIAALVFANLAWFGRTYNPAGKVEDLFPVETTVQSLQEQAGGERVVALQRGPVLFGPNVLAKFGLAEPSGYSSLVAARYHDLLTAADPELDSKLAGRASNHLLFSYPPPRLLDMLGVGHHGRLGGDLRSRPGRRVCPYRLYGRHGPHHGCLATGGHLRRVAHRHQPHRSALCCAPR